MAAEAEESPLSGGSVGRRRSGSGPSPHGSGDRRRSDAERAECRYGAKCHNYDEEHRRRFRHPEVAHNETTHRACKYGARCHQKRGEHLQRFVHPGDRNYRSGLVVFDDGQTPEFLSLRDLFNYCDPDESGHISPAEFAEARLVCSQCCQEQGIELDPDEWDKGWAVAGGDAAGYVNFPGFVHWAQASLRLDLPMGIDFAEGLSRPCRFRMGSSDERCGCLAFEASRWNDSICQCGHKTSMHRSDVAERKAGDLDPESTGGIWWEGAEEGLVEIEDEDVLVKLQFLLMSTHKDSDNWTRDRGCALHGRSGPGCSQACMNNNRAKVPTGYELVRAYRNQNLGLWQKYSLCRTAIAQECGRKEEVEHKEVEVATSESGLVLEVGLDGAINEWYLFHGTSPSKCKAICGHNFNTTMAGTGATWKDEGTTKGTPLYGFGIYFAERVTKADEYCELGATGGEEVFSVLLCRVVGGRANVVETNEIDVVDLKTQVFEGSYSSVFGDRVKKLYKPYREVVVYDKDQVFPEYLLEYRRVLAS